MTKSFNAPADANGLFNEADYRLVNTILATLPRLEREVIRRRFQDGMSVSEISAELHLDWDRVFQCLAGALISLRIRCLGNQIFSRWVARP